MQGIAKPGERPSQQEVLCPTLESLLSGRHQVPGEVIRRPGGNGVAVAAFDLTMFAGAEVVVSGELLGERSAELRVALAYSPVRLFAPFLSA